MFHVTCTHPYIRRTSVVSLTTAPRLAFNPLHVIECPPLLISVNRPRVFPWRLEFLRNSLAGCNVLKSRSSRSSAWDLFLAKRRGETSNGNLMMDPTKPGTTKDASTRRSRVLARLSADCDRWLEENTPSLLFFVLELSGSRPSHTGKKSRHGWWRVGVFQFIASSLVSSSNWPAACPIDDRTL